MRKAASHPARSTITTALTCLMLLTGCASIPEREPIVIDADAYDDTFEAAIEAVRVAGMPAVLRDRRAGIIETSSRTAGSFFEPWRVDNAGFDQSLQNTLNHQRRRTRIEFTPVDSDQPPFDPQQPLLGPDYAGAAITPRDLTSHEGPIRVDVVVIVERNHRPGQRRSTWTRTVRSQTTLGDVNKDLPANFWTPVTRDAAYEARLLQSIRNMIVADESS